MRARATGNAGIFMDRWWANDADEAYLVADFIWAVVHISILRAFRQDEAELTGVRRGCEIPVRKRDPNPRVAWTMEGSDQFARQGIAYRDPKFRIGFLSLERDAMAIDAAQSEESRAGVSATEIGDAFGLLPKLPSRHR